MTTNVGQFFTDLGAGVFDQKLSAVLSDVAGAVMDHNKAGKVTIELNMKRLGESHQVVVAHKLKFDRPTSRGKAMEEDTTETPMHVGAKGSLSFFPPDQGQLFTKKGEVENA